MNKQIKYLTVLLLICSVCSITWFIGTPSLNAASLNNMSAKGAYEDGENLRNAISSLGIVDKGDFVVARKEPVNFILSLYMLMLAAAFLVLGLLFRRNGQRKEQGVCFALCFLVLAVYFAVKSHLTKLLFADGLQGINPPVLIYAGLIAVTSAIVIYYIMALTTSRRDAVANKDKSDNLEKVLNELKVSEECYRLALTQSGKEFFFFDVPTRTLHLSEGLAKELDLPKDVDNMPDNPQALKLMEPRSLEKYRNFYNDIIKGVPSGELLLSMHMPQNPQKALWYKIVFTSIFDEHKQPQSAIITFEDYNEVHNSEIAKQWRPQNLLTVSEKEWVIADYNLSNNFLISQIGGLFGPVPAKAPTYDEIGAFVLAHFVAEEDCERYCTFLDRQRLLREFKQGVTEDVIEYKAVQSGTVPRWTRTTLQMIKDPYSDDVLGQLLIQDINVEKTGQLEMQHSMEELKKELENSRIRIMINQMQPHFLYNALSAIQTMVKTDPDYAYKLIYDFTVHLRGSIKALSSDQPISFDDELKNIKAYLNIEQMRFGNNLKVKYDIQCRDFKVVPLSIQPLAENAARHGVFPRGDKGGTITIRTYETLQGYVVEVSDDGVGFDVDAVMKEKCDSIGLKNTIFRLKSLMNADVTIESHVDRGTKATVLIPIDSDLEKGGQN